MHALGRAVFCTLPLLSFFAPHAVAQVRDTTTYRDAATRQFVELARARHANQDSLVRDYTASVHTRFEFSVGRNRFARALTLVAHETAADLTWRAPNDLKIVTRGARAASAFSGMQVNVLLGRPWFVPRSLGDRIRLMGTPETAALHPLAQGADTFYRYAISDSITIEVLGRTIHAVAVRVEPRRNGPSLVAGDMWLDAESGDVVRLAVLFVGEYLWERPDSATAKDSARALKENREAIKLLHVEVDLEYGLHQSKYWMPFRQLLKITAELPLFIDAAVPIQALTTFSDYRINTGKSITFSVAIADTASQAWASWSDSSKVCGGGADSLTACRRVCREEGCRRAARWPAGRWEIVTPPVDSLTRYQWPDRMALASDPEEEKRIHETVDRLARISEALPAEWVGRARSGMRIDDLFRFSRVQGASVGMGYGIRPGLPFTTVLGFGRYGFSDHRLTGSLTWRRDAPAGRFDVTVAREVREVEPWATGRGFGQSLNAVLTGHEDADYYLSLGGGLTYQGYAGRAADFEIGACFERQRSMAVVATSKLNDALGGDGVFEPNPAIADGDYVRLNVMQRAPARRVDLRIGGEMLIGEGQVTSRIWGSNQLPFNLGGRRVTLGLRAGAVGGDAPQMLYRVGGPGTVRGYRYGERVGHGFWSAQLDLPLLRSPLLTPVLFADAGGLFSDDQPLVGVGAGLAFLGGLLRLDFSKGVNPDSRLRFDLHFRSP